MTERISTVLYNTLKVILDTYPVLADIENSKMLAKPYAIYRVRESGMRTKETVKKKYDVGIFIVCSTFDESESVARKIESAMNLLPREEYIVSPAEFETKFDGDDRCYVCEMSFTIKKL